MNVPNIGQTPTKNVRALMLDNKANVWIGKWGGGVIIYDSEKEKFVSNAQINESTYDYVSAIERDKEDKIWIGTLEGITVFNQKNNSIKTFRTIDGLSSNQINCLFSDSKGRMWIGTFENGISVYKDGKFTNYDKSNGLKHLGVSIITEDKSGDIWIGTEGGGIFQFKDNQFKNFSNFF